MYGVTQTENGIWFEFKNHITVSIQVGTDNYCDNYGASKKSISKTVEIALWAEDESIHDVISYVNADEIPKILGIARRLAIKTTSRGAYNAVMRCLGKVIIDDRES